MSGTAWREKPGTAQKARATTAQAVSSPTGHCPTGPAHSGQGRMLVMGSISSLGKRKAISQVWGSL